MRNLFRNRRGSIAFATVIAMVPILGMVALGGEAGTWYVTKQQAQIAADAAAYSGALRLACGLGASCDDTANSVDYRGKQFAAHNAFCNAGDTSYPGSRCATDVPSGVSQSVEIAQLGSWKGAGGNFVQATVSQQQPTYLASLLGVSTVDIGATAVAQVVEIANPCVVSLGGPISFQGSTTVSAPGCGLSSNSKASNSIDFTGNGLNVSNAGSISGQGGCAETGGSRCDTTITYAPPVPNPYSGLDTAMASLTTASFTDGKCGATVLPYTAAKKCYNDKAEFKSTTTYNLSGVYFFGGNLKVSGNPTIQGTATLVLLPGATLSISGNPTFQLTALTTIATTQVPTALQSS